ncbi:MAG: hypothetical protein E7D27_15055 [Clostridium celatum]|nr:hypothetical protein [Clostridium celatum]
MLKNEVFIVDNSTISKEHIKFVSNRSGIDEETVIKVLEADTEYLDAVIGELGE